MTASKYFISAGTGVSTINDLLSFDAALVDAGVNDYNLIRLSNGALPPKCRGVSYVDISKGAFLPMVYSTISSGVEGETVVSAIGVGLPVDETQAGIVLGYSSKGFAVRQNIVLNTLDNAIGEAFRLHGLELKGIRHKAVSARVESGQIVTTFAGVAEW